MIPKTVNPKTPNLNPDIPNPEPLTKTLKPTFECQVLVTQYYALPNDVRTVTLTETGVDTNTFTGDISTSITFGEPELYAPEGSRIRIDYDDTAPLPGVINPKPKTLNQKHQTLHQKNQP